jgi:glycosyltransferase involved in cell wall biosynthesis
MPKTAIVLLTWKRLNTLLKLINRLNKQTMQGFDIFISNANKEEIEKVYEAANHFSSLNITVYDHDNSIFTFRRLHIGKDLAKAGYEAIMFIDDDIYIPTNYVELALNQYEPKTYKSVYAWQFVGRHYYNDRVRVVGVGKPVNYCGTATCILDASLFLEEKLFDAPEKIYKIEDLWMSYYAQHKLGWKLEYLDIPNVVIGGRDVQALYLEVAKEEYNKVSFLYDLVAEGWTFN